MPHFITDMNVNPALTHKTLLRGEPNIVKHSKQVVWLEHIWEIYHGIAEYVYAYTQIMFTNTVWCLLCWHNSEIISVLNTL